MMSCDARWSCWNRGVCRSDPEAIISWIELGAEISLSRVPGTVAPNAAPSHPPRLSEVSGASTYIICTLGLASSTWHILRVYPSQWALRCLLFCSYRASCAEDVSYLLIWPPADRPVVVPWSGCSKQSGGGGQWNHFSRWC